MDWRARSLAGIVSGALFYFGTGLMLIASVAVLAPFPVLWLAPLSRRWSAAAVTFLAFTLGTTNSWVLYADSVDVPIPMAAVIVVGTALIFTAVVALFRALMTWSLVVGGVVGARRARVGLVPGVGAEPGRRDGHARDRTGGRAGGVAGGVADGCVGRGLPVDADTGGSRGVADPRHRTATHHRGDGSSGARRTGVRTFRLATATDESHYRVALIGGNAKGQWATDVTTPDGQRKIAGYVRAIEQTTADLVVLPEGAFAATDNLLPTLVTPLTQMAAEKHATIVVGVVLNKHQNSAVAITDAHPPVVYDKWHDRGPKIVAGHDLRYLPNTDVGMVVCGDVNFANPFRDYGTDGADLIAIPASTAT